jgi:exopolyphosphatase/guanosine-5'-triphosphate,3'-diphosphate pyrophosphatase
VSTLRITFSPTSTAFAVGDQAGVMPVGPATLLADLRTDPPLPEELTNAVGWVIDHMEDIEREVPGVMWADRVEVAGHGVDVVAAIEVGGPADLPFELSRDAAEDVYRTVVTEPAADRAHNPGLPSESVHDVLGVACALVGVLRFLRCDRVWVVQA